MLEFAVCLECGWTIVAADRERNEAIIDHLEDCENAHVFAESYFDASGSSSDRDEATNGSETADR